MAHTTGNGLMAGMRWLPWSLLAVLPCIFQPDAVDIYDTIRWAALSLLALMAWVMHMRSWRAWIANFPTWGMACMVIFTSMGLLGLLTALHPLEACWDVARWLVVMGLVVALAAGIRSDPALLQDIWRAGTVAGLGLAAIGASQWLEWLGPIPGDGVPRTVTLGNANFYAAAMAILPAFGLGCARDRVRAWRWLGGAAAALCAAMTLLAGSLGAVLALGALAITAADVLVLRVRLARGYARLLALRRWLYGSAMVVMVAAAAWLLWTTTVAGATVQDSAEERILLWQKSLEMIRQAPVLGVGAGHWHYHILETGTVGMYQGFGTRYFTHAHNDLLEILAERGILGGLALLGFLAVAWRMGFSERGDDALAHGRRVAWLGLTAWIVFAMTNFPAAHPYLAALLAILAAVLLTQREGAAPMEDSRTAWLGAALRRMAPGVAAMFAVGALVSLCIHAAWTANATRTLDLMLSKALQDWPRVVQRAGKCDHWYQPHDRISATPFAWYAANAELQMGRAAAAIPLLEQARVQHPWHPQVLSNLGTAYFQAGDVARAATELQALVARFPAFDEARKNLTEVLLTQGRNAEAAETIRYWESHTGNPAYDGYRAHVEQYLRGASPAQ